ncbi:MAG: hypothetical protein D6784_16530 [Chloroflexi bacterium]|nr:MAG: hypothetical protein D6784_16530 [Chloroflexota bacterium]
MGTIQPWPEKARPLRKIIVDEQEHISAILEVCLAEGMEDQNYNLVDLLLPKIRPRAERIKETCKEIAHLIPRRGRTPKWGEIALDINAHSRQILRCLDLIKQESRHNRYITVAHLLNLALKHSRAIADRLDDLPYNDVYDIDIPEVWYEAFGGDE